MDVANTRMFQFTIRDRCSDLENASNATNVSNDGAIFDSAITDTVIYLCVTDRSILIRRMMCHYL